MKVIKLLAISSLYLLLFTATLNATTIYVNSQQSFDDAHDNAAMNDSIVWRAGTYSNIYMNILKDHLLRQKKI